MDAECWPISQKPCTKPRHWDATGQSISGFGLRPEHLIPDKSWLENLGLQPLRECVLPGVGSTCVLSLLTVTCRPEHLLYSMEQLFMSFKS